MQAIAEFVMRSRAHAIATSMIAAVLPLLGWLSTVIVALVCLRHGIAAGSLVLLWTLLPIGVALYFVGDPSPVIALVGTFLLAALLRHTLSWELVLIALVVISALGTVLFELTAVDLLDRFVTFYMDYIRQIDPDTVILPEQARTVLVGLFAALQATAMAGLLIIARWCQSALYNPGGFRKEFHGLRLSPAVSTGAVLLIALCFAFNEHLGRWLPLLTVPLFIAALGLSHWLMATRSLSKGWVAGFYGSLVFLFQLVYPFLVSMALMDSWINVRNRLNKIQKD
jgi:hypothetical protein